MTSFEDGFPETGGSQEPYILDKESIFRLLSSAGLAELTAGDGLTTIHVDSTPKDTGELYMNPDGKPVLGFMTKFSEGFTGWKNGDLVRARYVVSPKGKQMSLLVADSYVGDIRHADEFALEGEPEELAKLRSLGITELDLDLEVTSEEREYNVSNMFKYSARIDRVNDVLAPWDGKSELEPGQVLVQGRVSEYVPQASNNDWRDKSPTYMILDVNGKPVVINMNGGYVAYKGSKYERLLSEKPEVGDVVQVLATYTPDFEQQPYGRKRVSAFDASWCRSSFCLEANPARAAKQEAFNKTVESTINDLSVIADPVDFRKKYGELINLAFVQTGSFVKNCLTDEQAIQVATIVEQVFPDGEVIQKPLLAVSKDFPSIFSSFKEEYDVDIYSMSVEEAYEFVLEIAQDPAKLDPKIVQTDYLFRVVDDALAPAQMSTLATAVINAYYPATVRKGLSFEKEDYKPEPGIVPYNQHSLTESAILQLGLTGRTEDTNTLLELFEQSVENDLFSHKRGEDDYMSKIVDSLSYGLTKAANWSGDKGWHEVTDKSTVAHFRDTIVPRLVATMGAYTAKVESIGEVGGERYAAIGHSFALSRAQEIVELTDELTALAA